MNNFAYDIETAWNRGTPWTFLKTLIQLYLLCLFLYSLNYCIREVIKGKIIWILNEKIAGPWGRYGLKQGNLLQKCYNTDSIVFVLFIFLFLTYVIKEGIKVINICTLNLKVLAYEAATTWSGESIAKT